jgi:hypothetical protein
LLNASTATAFSARLMGLWNGTTTTAVPIVIRRVRAATAAPKVNGSPRMP